MWELERRFIQLKFFFWLILAVVFCLFVITETSVVDKLAVGFSGPAELSDTILDYATTVKAWPGTDIRNFPLPGGGVARVRITVEK